jgi:fatty-acid desaturase
MNKLSSSGLFFLQLICHGAFIYWILSNPSIYQICIVIFMYFIMGCLGMSVTYHRLLTHRSFTTSKIWEYLGTFFASISFTGSSLSWTAAHRQHHVHADKQKDPHSPSYLGYIKAQWMSMFSQIDIKRSPLIKSSFHRFMHRHYININLIYGFILFLIGGINFVLIFWLVPACIVWNAGSLINTVCHTKLLGYRRYTTNDLSVNNPFLGVFMWGEGWHNNHHRYQNRPNIGEKFYEIDIGYYCICLIRQKNIS